MLTCPWYIAAADVVAAAGGSGVATGATGKSDTPSRILNVNVLSA